MAEDLPPDIAEILAHLASMARGYDNHLKWNEEAKLKADLMHSREYWLGVPVPAIASKCRELGMRSEDVALIADLVTRAQQGRRLVPQASYRAHKFRHERPGGIRQPSSRDW